MLELTTTFTPADGGAPRRFTFRISDVRQTGTSWSARVDAIGFEPDHTSRVHGIDWFQAIELAARFLASESQRAGAGTFDPPVFPRGA